MAKRELQMLEMMRNILGVDSSDLGGRSQRSSPMLYAASVPCEDSLPEDSSDSLNFFDEDLDDSEECGDFGRPCESAKEVPTELEPCPRPMVPMDHPCFVRVIVLRTPLLRHDPCTNFTLAVQSTSTTTTTTSPKPKPKSRKCKPKKAKPKPESRMANSDNTTSPATTTIITTTAQTEAETSVESTTTVQTTTSQESENNTTMMSTTTEEDSTTMEITTSLRSRRRKTGKRRPSVPDTPKIKLDGAMQSSDALPVFRSTEVGELRSRKETTTKANEVETTTPDCVEDTSEMEINMDRKANDGNETEELSSSSDDCEDAEDQDTNLCPQFSAPEEPANMRLLPASRYRKPVKNYVEPILYEGQFAKPRQRIGMLPPQRRDYYVSNKQIMPRPRPKYREPLPHSIYMNNIVRGVKCSDEVGGHPHPHPLQGRRYRNGKPTPPQRIWMGRRHVPGYAPAQGSQPPSHGHVRERSNPLYGLSSAEDLDSFGHDSDQYYDDGSAELHAWSHEQHSQTSSPTVDPCQAEHNQERERER
ncbi:uncharacterized protein LOC117779764, partial [Drosophila innubila]|uniref:uncharacterized protein LOC117779764 n=1 Tax=Drosophila innubila TaxID=198719 RepID=UPI00148BB17A